VWRATFGPRANGLHTPTVANKLATVFL